MTSLVPGVVFPTPGLNRRSTRVSTTATPSEIDAKYARAPLNGSPWPRSSPVARVYDICNTSTKLILYNNERSTVKERPPSTQTGTHLRGQTKSSGSIRKPSPDRHQTPDPRVNRHHHSQCTVSQTERFHARPQSTLSWRDKPILYDNKSPVNPKYHAPCKVSRDNEGLRWERPRPYRRPRNAAPLPPYMCGGTAAEREFTKGEKTYLWSIARIYSVDNLKRLKQDQYLKLLAQEKQRGTHSKAEYQRYSNYLKRMTSATSIRRRPSPSRGKDKPPSPSRGKDKPPSPSRGKDKSPSPKARRREQQRAARSYPRQLNDSFSSQTSSSTLQSRGSSSSASRASARSQQTASGSSHVTSRAESRDGDRTPQSARSASLASSSSRSSQSTPRKAEPKEEQKDAGTEDKAVDEDKKAEGEKKADEDKEAEEETNFEEDKRVADEKEKADEEKKTKVEEETAPKETPEDRSSREEEDYTVSEESRAREQEAEGETAREQGKKHQLSLLKQLVTDKTGDQQDEDDIDSQTATDASTKSQDQADDSKKLEADVEEDEGRQSQPDTKQQEEITPRSSSSEKHQEGRDRPKSRIGRTNAEGRRVEPDSDDDYDTDFENEAEEEETKSANDTSNSQPDSPQEETHHKLASHPSGEQETHHKLASPSGEQKNGHRADHLHLPKGDGTEGDAVYTDRRQGEGDRDPEVPPGTEMHTKVEGAHAAAPSPTPSTPPPDPDTRGDNTGLPTPPSPPPPASSSPPAPATRTPSPPPAPAPSPSPVDRPQSPPRRKDSIEEGREERTEVTNVDNIEY